MSSDCPCGDIKSCLSELPRAIPVIEDSHDSLQRIVAEGKAERNQRPRTLHSKKTGDNPEVAYETS